MPPLYAQKPESKPCYNQVELSVCAGPDTRWLLAPVADFPTVCGGWDITPTNNTGVCEAGVHGPPCSSNADCIDVTNCLRCAGSGYCTDVPL